MKVKTSTDKQLLKFAEQFSVYRHLESSIRAAHAEITHRLSQYDTTELRLAQAHAAQSIAAFDAQAADQACGGFSVEAFHVFSKAGFKAMMMEMGASMKLFGGALEAFAEEQATRMMKDAHGV